MIKLTDKNKFSILKPDLCNEWSDKNELTPNNYTVGSNQRVLWKCSKEDCKHEWKTTISHRAKGSGCPKCCGLVVSDNNRLSILRPNLIEEWSHENEFSPNDYSVSSHKKVLWICKKENCRHTWDAVIKDRSKGRGCPCCSGIAVSDNNRFSILMPELIAEWNDRNEISPDKCTIGSDKKRWWICKNEECRYEWQTSIANRANGTGCPKCSKCRISKSAMSWLLYLNLPNDSDHIEVYCKELRIYFDGYEPSTNTVYEFHGDYWHGNPKKYNPNKINSRAKKSFGELYNNTLEREQRIISSGYNLVTTWESDWKKLYKQKKGIK